MKSGARREISFLVQGTLTRPSVPYHKLYGCRLRRTPTALLEYHYAQWLAGCWSANMDFPCRNCGRYVPHACDANMLPGYLVKHEHYDERLNLAGGIFRGGGHPTKPMPCYDGGGGGGGAPPNDGIQIKRIRDIDCRFTVHQARMLLSSARVTRAANSGDYWALRQAIEVEHKRLNLWPKGRTTESTKKEYPKPSDKEPAQISLQDDQITVRGQPVPVRASLRQDCSGVQLVNTAEELKRL
eukprot:1452097-Amphidinium_carterae.1